VSKLAPLSRSKKEIETTALDVALMLTIAQAGRLLNLSPRTIVRLIRNGELTARKIGGRTWRIPRASLEAFCRKDHSTGEENRLAEPVRRGSR
jgi:excisionase family DNA binding protein